MKVINLHQEEKEIIQLAVDNNRQAQQQIYTRFSPKMLSICRLYVKDIQQAEDVMITSFMKVFTSLKNFQHNGSFEGWIRRIIVNECISFLRVNKKVNFIEDAVYVEESDEVEECELSSDDIQFMIDNLAVGYKMVFNLYAIEGFKHKEIAVMLEISEGTSKSQLSHARKILQQQINATKSYDYGTK
ncbi:RNA polymerase sigma factor [Flavobacterium frigoris]|uniref:RNA polymerase ECF-type sigma factor n=1 Tax=Flavobacterium frigoris (strain PS1) TaxID=1086011 RepID=H7FQV0_FLAFP|nr:RNA polymerase sigma factor [Flavobacterium frigoris]EIA09087.1 RNA polymerase ECF-type sigma factor [Flavobacterium frigoris PS1]